MFADLMTHRPAGRRKQPRQRHGIAAMVATVDQSQQVPWLGRARPGTTAVWTSKHRALWGSTRTCPLEVRYVCVRVLTLSRPVPGRGRGALLLLGSPAAAAAAVPVSASAMATRRSTSGRLTWTWREAQSYLGSACNVHTRGGLYYCPA